MVLLKFDVFLWVSGQRINFRSELAACALRTFFSALFYCNWTVWECRVKEFLMYKGIFFSFKHKAQELVATEHLSKCILLMECPHLVRVELNMLFGGVDAP